MARGEMDKPISGLEGDILDQVETVLSTNTNYQNLPKGTFPPDEEERNLLINWTPDETLEGNQCTRSITVDIGYHTKIEVAVNEKPTKYELPVKIGFVPEEGSPGELLPLADELLSSLYPNCNVSCRAEVLTGNISSSIFVELSDGEERLNNKMGYRSFQKVVIIYIPKNNNHGRPLMTVTGYADEYGTIGKVEVGLRHNRAVELPFDFAHDIGLYAGRFSGYIADGDSYQPAVDFDERTEIANTITQSVKDMCR